jgi:hypothetical protein
MILLIFEITVRMTAQGLEILLEVHKLHRRVTQQNVLKFQQNKIRMYHYSAYHNGK